MDDDRERRIRERAHAIWEREGRPDTRHEDHWHQAIRELDAEEALAGGPTTATAPSGGDPDSGGGLATGLQPGGTIPGGSPGTGVGSIGTGGGSTAGEATGTLGRTGG